MSEDRFKFKVYRKETGKLLGSEYRGQRFWIDNEGRLMEDDYDCYMSEPCEDLIVCFCTGLKDKNGKLIYEGDLIRDTREEYDSDLFMIEWNQDGAWQLSYVDGSQFDFTISSFIVERSEIVGNRWENPELLKDQDDK